MDGSAVQTLVPPELFVMGHGTEGSPARVCTRVAIPSHHKFGPYQAKTRKDPSPDSINWKVSPDLLSA